MRTGKQREAARRNGAKSRGPKTAEGKAVSSRNALRHGLASQSVLLPHESQDEFDTLRRQFIERYQPADGPELCLVDQMFIATWLLRRACAAESHVLMELAGGRQNPLFGDRSDESFETSILLALGDSARDGRVSALRRYCAHLERSYDRAFRNLRTLQKDRPPAEVTPEPSAPAPHENLQNEPGQPLTPTLSMPSIAAAERAACSAIAPRTSHPDSSPGWGAARIPARRASLAVVEMPLTFRVS